MRRVTPLVLAVAMLAAGCGGPKSPEARYAAALDSMCADFQSQERKIGTPHGIHDLAVNGPAIAEAFRVAILVPLDERKPPAGLAADGQRLRALARKQHDALLELAAAAASGEGSRILAAAKLNTRLNAESGVIAKRLGAKRCSGG